VLLRLPYLALASVFTFIVRLDGQRGELRDAFGSVKIRQAGSATIGQAPLPVLGQASFSAG
jgi:hypothetical protein